MVGECDYPVSLEDGDSVFIDKHIYIKILIYE